MQRVAVLGSTGSIGTNCLEVIGALPGQLSLRGVAARQSWQALGEQSRRFAPRYAVLEDSALRPTVPRDAFSPQTELLFGPDAVAQLASDPEVDVVVSSIVGAAGLAGTWAALEAGKRVCLANKETLVVAGPLVMDLARKNGVPLLPVDSEHSAIFQALQSGRPQEVRRIVLTASGGPFRGWTRDQLEQVTPEMALRHPNWKMGPKITIDSATLMNKALEVIEARWLFDLGPDQIEVVVHPQSIVHSFVEFVDGSVMAQLGPPDMKLPIQYALTFPERLDGPAPRLDWNRNMHLDFHPLISKHSLPWLWDSKSPGRGARAERCSMPPTNVPWNCSCRGSCGSSTFPALVARSWITTHSLRGRRWVTWCTSTAGHGTR